MNGINFVSPKTNKKFFIIGFIGTFLLNVVAFFIFSMNTITDSELTISASVVMAICVIIPLMVFCISIYIVRFRKNIKLTLWNCAKGSVYCTLITVVVLAAYYLYILCIYGLFPRIFNSQPHDILSF